MAILSWIVDFLASVIVTTLFHSLRLQQKAEDFIIAYHGGITKQDRLVTSNFVDKIMEDHKRESNILKQKEQRAQAEIKSMKKELTAANRAIESGKRSLELEKSKVSNRSNANWTLSNNLRKVEQETRDLYEELSVVTIQLKQRDKQFSDVSNERDELAKKFEDLQKKNEEQKVEFEKKMAEDRAVYQAAIDADYERFHSTQERNERWGNIIAIQNAHVQELEKQLYDSALREKLPDDFKREKKLKKNIRELKKEVSDVESQNVDLLVTISKMQDEQEASATESAVQLAYLHKEHMKKEKASNSRIQKLRKESEQLKNDLEAKENKATGVLEAIQALEKENDQLKQDLVKESEELGVAIKLCKEMHSKKIKVEEDKTTEVLEAIQTLEKEKDQLKQDLVKESEELGKAIRLCKNMHSKMTRGKENKAAEVLEAIQAIEKEKDQMRQDLVKEGEELAKFIKWCKLTYAGDSQAEEIYDTYQEIVVDDHSMDWLYESD